MQLGAEIQKWKRTIWNATHTFYLAPASYTYLFLFFSPLISRHWRLERMKEVSFEIIAWPGYRIKVGDCQVFFWVGGRGGGLIILCITECYPASNSKTQTAALIPWLKRWSCQEINVKFQVFSWTTVMWAVESFGGWAWKWIQCFYGPLVVEKISNSFSNGKTNVSLKPISFINPWNYTMVLNWGREQTGKK